MSDIDRMWFKKHPSENMRMRLAGPGEVEKILRHAVPATAYEIAALGGSIPALDPGFKWVVMVIKIDATSMLRMLVLRPTEWTEEPTQAGWTVYSATFGSRALIDRIGG